MAADLTVSVRPSQLTVVLPAPGTEATATFEAVVAGESGQAKYTWKRDGTAIVDATSAKYTFQAKAADDGATFEVEVEDGAGKKAASEPAKLSVSAEAAPVVWDPPFAIATGLALTALFALAAWPLWRLEGRVRAATSVRVAFPAAVALGLVAAGLLAALAGVYLALLEFRGRARAAEAALIGRRPVTGPGGTTTISVSGFQWTKEAGEGVAAVLDSFGKLRNTAALLALSAALFLFGMLLSWQALPETKPATTSTTAPTGTSPTTTGAEVPPPPPPPTQVPPPPPPPPPAGGATTVG